MKKRFSISILMILCLSVSSLFGQTPFTSAIQVVNGSDTISLTLGTAVCATADTNACAGESELPPVPPAGVFDARFVKIRSSQKIGQGLTIDIRNSNDDYAKDTFKIAFQPSTEGGSTVTLSWDANIGDFGGGYWHLMNSLSSPVFDIDMTTQTSYNVNTDDYTSVFIVKGDASSFRTFNLEDLALDGTVDAKGKKSYGKSYKGKPDKVEFEVTFTNPYNDTVPVNGLHVEYGIAVDSNTMENDAFPTQHNTKGTKWDFSGTDLDSGDAVTTHAFAIKAGNQKVSNYWWTYNGTPVGGKKYKISGKTLVFSNSFRNHMPNSVNAGEEMMLQAFPLKTDYLFLGVYGADKKGPAYIQLKKYADVIKTLVVNAGKVGKQVLNDDYASCLDKLDKVKGSGDRVGKSLVGPQKTLAPDKHRNALVGQTLTLAVNIKLSATQKTPAGLNTLEINDPTSLFDGESLDSLLAQANQYLTYCTVGANPLITASDLVDEISRINSSFNGDIDTISYSGTKVKFTGTNAIATVPFLKRNSSMVYEIIPDLTADVNIPETFSLGQNYPNPFNPTTTINFTLPENGIVTVKIFNLLGQEVATIADQQEFASGINQVEFNAASLSSGVYFYRLNVNSVETGEVTFQDIKKMVLVK